MWPITTNRISYDMIPGNNINHNHATSFEIFVKTQEKQLSIYYLLQRDYFVTELLI